MEIARANHEGKTVLTFNGRIDTSTAPELEHGINKEIENRNRKILLDFSQVSNISSGGLRVLLATAKKLKNPGDKFGICSPQPEILKIFKLIPASRIVKAFYYSVTHTILSENI